MATTLYCVYIYIFIHVAFLKFGAAGKTPLRDLGVLHAL